MPNEATWAGPVATRALAVREAVLRLVGGPSGRCAAPRDPPERLAPRRVQKSTCSDAVTDATCSDADTPMRHTIRSAAQHAVGGCATAVALCERLPTLYLLPVFGFNAVTFYPSNSSCAQGVGRLSERACTYLWRISAGIRCLRVVTTHIHTHLRVWATSPSPKTLASSRVTAIHTLLPGFPSNLGARVLSASPLL